MADAHIEIVDIEQPKITAVACILPTKNGKCNAYLPDFKITVHANSITDAITRAQTVSNALYNFNKERDITIPITTTYEKAIRRCKSKGSFVTHVALDAR